MVFARIPRLSGIFDFKLVNKADNSEEEVDEEEINSEIQRLLDNKDSTNTSKITKLAYSLFSCVADIAKAEKNLSNLDKELAKFYATAKKKDGSRYKAGTLLTFRQGLRRYYEEKLNIDIVNDRKFSYSSKVFKATLTDLRRQGLRAVKHHTPITKGDMAKLYSGETNVFDIETPVGLPSSLVPAKLCTIFVVEDKKTCMRAMTKTTFDIATDSTGRRYVYQEVYELDKNHQDLTAGHVTQGRMYELPGRMFIDTLLVIR